VALEEMESVEAAYIGKSITLVMSGDAAPEQEALTKMLKNFRINVSAMEKTAGLPF
jgi:transcriptional regulator